MQSANKYDPKKRATLIRDILIKNEDMFLSEVKQNLSQQVAKPEDFNAVPKSSNFQAQSRWPLGSNKSLNSPVLLLRDGIGGITIEEIYVKNSLRDKEASLVAFTYRFIDKLHKVQFQHELNETIQFGKNDNYNYRYDMDLRPTSKDPKYHLQVSNNAPRFVIPNGFELQDFLATVRKACFKEDYSVNLEPYWNSRR